MTGATTTAPAHSPSTSRRRRKATSPPIHCSGGDNLFFVDRTYYDRFEIEDDSPAKIYTPSADPKREEGPPYLPVGESRIPKKVSDR